MPTQSWKAKTVIQKKDDEVSTGRFIWWGVWIVLMIVRVATCNDRSSKNDDFNKFSYQPLRTETSFDNYSEKQNEKFLLQQFDSLLQKRTCPQRR